MARAAAIEETQYTRPKLSKCVVMDGGFYASNVGRGGPSKCYTSAGGIGIRVRAAPAVDAPHSVFYDRRRVSTPRRAMGGDEIGGLIVETSEHLRSQIEIEPARNSCDVARPAGWCDNSNIYNPPLKLRTTRQCTSGRTGRLL